MDGLNYHHLQYFWLVAKEGSIAKAATRLNVSQPTISTQLKRLEKSVGEPLFQKRGRNLELTATGRQAYEYADRIFAIGRELSGVLRGGTAQRAQPFVVGVQSGLPAAVVDRILRPAFHLTEPMQLICRTDELMPLVAELAINRVQLVLSETILDPAVLIRAVCRPVADAVVILRGRDDLIQRYRRGFPKSLDDAPLLLPGAGSTFRQQLEAWFDANRIQPQRIAESDNPALLESFAQAGLGLQPCPQFAEGSETRSGSPPVLGPLADLRVQYYAIARDEPFGHPALAAVLAAAK